MSKPAEGETPRTRAMKYIESRIERVPISGCWIWTKAVTSRGYGSLVFNNVPMTAHRFSFETFVGRVQGGHYVMHICDVQTCVNPSHLRVGTPSDNLKDAYQKCRRGKITPQQWVEISRRISSGETKTSLAKEFGVHRSAITWRVRHKAALSRDSGKE